MRYRIEPMLTLERSELLGRGLVASAIRERIIELDVSAVHKIEPGAAQVLGNSLCLASANCQLEVTIAGRQVPNSEKLSVLVRSGLAFHLLAFSSSIKLQGGEESPKAVEMMQGADLGETAMVIDPFEIGAWQEDERVARLEDEISNWLRSVRSSEVEIDSFSADSLASLVTESCVNVPDHGYRLLDSSDARCAYGMLRFHHYSSLFIADIVEAPLSRYIDSMSAKRPLGFIEVTVVDDGVGIPARHSLSDRDYYEATSEREERSALRNALTDGASVKPRSRDCRITRDVGYGSQYIAEAISNLRGIISLRTGRSIATLDGEVSGDPMTAGFNVEEESQRYLPGTIINCLIPVGIAPRYEHGQMRF